MHRSTQEQAQHAPLEELQAPPKLEQPRLSEIEQIPGPADIPELLALRASQDNVVVEPPRLKGNIDFVEHPLFFRYANPISTQSSGRDTKSPPVLFESGLGSSSLSLLLSSGRIREFADEQESFCEYRTLDGCRGHFDDFKSSTSTSRREATLKWLEHTRSTHTSPAVVSFSGSAVGMLEAIEALSSVSKPAVQSLVLLSPLLFLNPRHSMMIQYLLPALNLGQIACKPFKAFQGSQNLQSGNTEWSDFSGTNDYAKQASHIVADVEYLDITYSRIPNKILSQLPRAVKQAQKALQSIIANRYLKPQQILAIFGDRELETAIDASKSIRFLEDLGIQCIEIPGARHRPQLTHLDEVEKLALTHIKHTAAF